MGGGIYSDNNTLISYILNALAVMLAKINLYIIHLDGSIVMRFIISTAFEAFTILFDHLVKTQTKKQYQHDSNYKKNGGYKNS